MSRRARRGESRRLVESIAAGHDGEGCVVWPFARTAGYGVVGDWRQPTTPRPVVLVCRIAWELRHGLPFPAGLVGRHLCGGGADGCVNLAHVVPGTQLENVHDTIAMGRHNIGERNGQAKITDAQVREVRALAADGVRQVDIAKRFGLTPNGVYVIVSGRRRRAA